MKVRMAMIVLASTLLLSGCTGQEEATPPAPFALTDDAMGR